MKLHHPCHRPVTDTKASGIEIRVRRVALPIRMIRTSVRNASKSGFGPGLESDTGALDGKVASTGGFDRFAERGVGFLELKKGSNRILMRAAGKLDGELIDLRAIRLQLRGNRTIPRKSAGSRQ